MNTKRPTQSRTRRKAVPKKCLFCQEQKVPWFTDVDVLRRFLTERSKIIPRSRSGLCAKHQRRLTVAIKHARHLSLLPFLVRE